MAQATQINFRQKVGGQNNCTPKNHTPSVSHPPNRPYFLKLPEPYKIILFAGNNWIVSGVLVFQIPFVNVLKELTDYKIMERGETRAFNVTQQWNLT